MCVFRKAEAVSCVEFFTLYNICSFTLRFIANDFKNVFGDCDLLTKDEQNFGVLLSFYLRVY